MAYSKRKYRRQILRGRKAGKAKRRNKASLHRHVKNSRSLSRRQKKLIHRVVKRA